MQVLKRINTQNSLGAIVREDNIIDNRLAGETLAIGDLLTTNSNNKLIKITVAKGNPNSVVGVCLSNGNNDDYVDVLISGSTVVNCNTDASQIDEVVFKPSVNKFTKTTESGQTLSLLGAKFIENISSAGLVSVYIPQSIQVKKD